MNVRQNNFLQCRDNKGGLALKQHCHGQYFDGQVSVRKQWSECGSLQCRDNKGGLTLKEIWNLTEGNRNIMDPTGWVAEKLEWFVTYYLFADDDVSLSLCNSLPCLPLFMISV